jgi:hypothetical protein
MASVEHHSDKTRIQVPGQRHRCVFDFARRLKGHPELAGCNPVSLAPYVEKWYERALPHIQTKVFNETLSDFVRAWDFVKWPAGGGSLRAALARAKAMPVPDCAMRFRKPARRLLVALCRELQRERGDQPFFLSCRDAAGALGLSGREPHVTAWRWLKELCQADILKHIQSGTLKRRKASEYRYLPPIH